MATWKMLLLQDSASPLMEQLSFFHDHTLMILLMITVLVGYLMSSLFFNKYNYRYLLEGQTIEVIWTILPAVTLIFIALPSLRLLYLLDEINNPLVSMKTIGHQWYWSYEYTDFKNIEFDSYMIPTSELNKSSFRLLDVDNRAVLPYNSQIRLMVTAADVLHSWTIPALSVKIDATPGRLNQVSFLLNRTGLFFGQCSEICGANHSFMPIVLESISPTFFIKWVSKMGDS
uniref:Cytochrome c oxidase subunit 2 n=3 Tax=Lucaninae TaxID=614534 RepID=A0A5J6NCU7_9SCAR|nr:cytochrome c oxidase subunit II [Velutinodorcus velutinus]YP_009709666.1 cytochrome c oxidase subunit II [Dorcus ursulus]YP_009709679.1 cytochrome c oxidase subunit II [Dorcus tenuihirsutus]QEX51672.1 cytochrome c oxidase subunit II [Velutinodorcus velutinus]QEX51685.1 cytochrome c oxidase subunit II [Dorcus ursulus]QEX51698.1 cytochrome c oxidase subunit II [Dorcus tenuihirsutus]